MNNARRNIQRLALLCCLLLVGWHRAAAQPLDTLVRRAVEKHPSVAALRIAVQQADARARSAEAWEAPQAGIEFRMLPPSNPNPFAKGETMLMVEQMIPLFGQNRTMAKAMSAMAEVSEAQLAALQRELRMRVESEYYTLWLLQQRAALNEENQEIAAMLYRTVEARYEVNRTAQSDVFSAALEQEKLATEAREIEEETNEVQARLNALLSQPVGTPIAVEDSVSLVPLPAFEELVAHVREHPMLHTMEAMAAQSRAAAAAKEAMLSPMLMLRGGIAYMPEGHPLREATPVQHAATGMNDAMKFGITAGAMISIPIVPWARSGAEAAADADRLQAEEALQQRDGMEQELVGQLRAAYAKAARIQLQERYYRATQLPLLEQTLVALQNDYANSRVPFSSVLNGYSMLVMAKLELAMKHMEYAMTLSMITQLTGGL